MTDEEKEVEFNRKNLEQVDWNLPGMEEITPQQRETLTRSILNGDIVNSIHSLGWSLWPTKNRGYYDEVWLRCIARFIEIQNKPFWDDYEKYCDGLMEAEDDDGYDRHGVRVPDEPVDWP